MKKIFVLVFISFLFIQNSLKAQQAGNLAYEIDDIYLHAGIGIGYYNYGYDHLRYGLAIPLTVSVEYGFHEYLSAGVFIGFANYKYDTYVYKYSVSHINFGGRGTFHFAGLMNDNINTNIDLQKFDLYLSFAAGLSARTVREISGTIPPSGPDGGIGILFGPSLGVKYKLNDKIGAYLEGGRASYGWGTIGVSVNLN